MGGSATDDDWELTSPSNGVRTVVLVGHTGNGKSATAIVFLQEEPSSGGRARLVLLVLVKCTESCSKMAKLLMSLIPLDYLIFLLAPSLLARKLSNVSTWPRMRSMQSL
ncbi:hypothetical protein CUMW_274980 [Citrus unshiu]|uniref:Uncharacterized protein n=1 Tax=Citrus unshiu TaxID=55188 RepID=A0A2H5MZY0_CITUN|nr:hypothetical protein CUMW_274980 [Citrus unshiu]